MIPYQMTIFYLTKGTFVRNPFTLCGQRGSTKDHRQSVCGNTYGVQGMKLCILALRWLLKSIRTVGIVKQKMIIEHINFPSSNGLT